eukprot:s3346_g1.t1
MSAYAAAYTASFGSFVARVILEECRIRENPVTCLLDPESWDVHAVDDIHERPKTAQSDSQSSKRPRYSIKGPPRGPDIERERVRYGRAPTWESFVRSVGSRVPRVGNFVLRTTDPGFEDVQLLVPEMHVKMVLVCRGTERYRVPGSHAGSEEVPWRKTIIVRRADGVVQDLGPPENWQALSRIQQTRKAGSARMSITVFGTLESQQSPANAPNPPSQKSVVVGHSGVDVPMSDVGDRGDSKGELIPIPESGEVLDENPKGPSQAENRVIEVEAWAPKIIPRSGPAFEALSNQQKTDLRRLHSNLGHPNPEKLCRVLTENGADAEVIAAARDYQCDVCVENKRGPTLPSPSTIHELREFNDCVGCDGVYWKSRAGVTYHFMHFIDEATLFHLGTPSGRTVEDQIKTFEDTWLHWAGPCKLLYLDPAGEYVNDKWHEFLQKENIRVSMTAGDSHWQLGRAESHGHIVKRMLTSMDLEEPIVCFDDFKRCLRQAFAAKNSMGQVRGFSPEQAVLGKARSLPGSLVSDAEATSHSLLDSESSEGAKFREDMLRRERARRAFVSADNDSSIRRALLRADGYSLGKLLLLAQVNNAPRRDLSETLEGLGFVVAPFDGCVFSLITKDSKGQPQVRGCLGLHVDDGIGGGDSYFREIIGRLRKKFEFGAYNEGEFEFCGVKYFQWDDGSIEMSQDSYIQKIAPIEIPRHRRMQSQESLTPTETQRLRQLCGSLQYAAVHTRPDLAAKVGEVQAMVTKACVEHMVTANRILYEAKTRPVNLMIVPIQENQVTFCAFSDASFETGKGQSTRQGTLIFATDGNMERNVKTVVCPMAWASRKIPRVVRSTLSAEAVALGATLDRLSWLRVFWEWMKNPSVDWSQPSEVLGRAPKALLLQTARHRVELRLCPPLRAASASVRLGAEGPVTGLEQLLKEDLSRQECRIFGENHRGGFWLRIWAGDIL